MRDGSVEFAPSRMSILVVGYGSLMPPHRDWTRHGVGRALLWWPFTAFVVVAAFPALAVPGMIASGMFLIVVGLVGGFVGRRRRARRLRDAGRILGAAPRAVAAAVRPPSADPGDRRDSDDTGASADDAEGDSRADEDRRAA